jgi:hypothetical protein
MPGKFRPAGKESEYMLIISFIICAVVFFVAAVLFGRGLVNMHGEKENARSLISSGFVVGLIGVVIAAIVFGVFTV